MKSELSAEKNTPYMPESFFFVVIILPFILANKRLNLLVQLTGHRDNYLSKMICFDRFNLIPFEVQVSYVRFSISNIECFNEFKTEITPISLHV